MKTSGANTLPRKRRSNAPVDDNQDWWRGYHTRDSEVSQLQMIIDRLKREAKRDHEN